MILYRHRCPPACTSPIIHHYSHFSTLALHKVKVTGTAYSQCCTVLRILCASPNMATLVLSTSATPLFPSSTLLPTFLHYTHNTKLSHISSSPLRSPARNPPYAREHHHHHWNMIFNGHTVHTDSWCVITRASEHSCGSGDPRSLRHGQPHIAKDPF